MLGIKREEHEQQPEKKWIGPAPWIQTSLPGPNAMALIERDQRWSSPSSTREYPLVAQRGVGSVIEDVDGNRFLDFGAGLAVCATGHCHAKVTSAIESQSKALIHICGQEFYYPPMVELMERLASIVPGSQPQRVLLTNSGAEAVEAAITLCRYHTHRQWIIGFHGALHGRTMGALTLTCTRSRLQDRSGPLVPMVAHAPYGDVEAIEEQLFKRQMQPREVAAVFVEAIQSETGYTVPDPSFLPDLRALCDKHGILLVCDEIQSGVGRTGKWFAFEHSGIVPDVVLMAKGIASGMPLGAVVARAEVMDWGPDAQGTTFGGNPVCCAAALATLDLVESTYMANAARLGEQLSGKLRRIAEQRRILANVRGIGLMHAVDVVSRVGKSDPKRRHRILQGAFERGLVLLPSGEHSIRFCPPLCINDVQLDVGLRIFDEVVGATS